MSRLKVRAAIYRYVFEYGGFPPVTSVSCFRAAVRDARQLTGRNVDTGILRPRLQRGKAVWPGTLVYLVLLDQVGQVISPVSRPPTKEPFVDALVEFAPTLDERTREALYALRCAFAHEYGLTNVGRGRKAHLRTHLFQLYESSEPRLIQFPASPWNTRHGVRANAKTGTTHVNLVELGNVVEAMISNIEMGARAGSLRLVNGMTPAVVMGRFGFRVIDYT